MVGPSSTLRKPDVAPAQIVMEMDVALHELTVIGKSFKTTKLELWVVPKLDPVIVTCVPIGPVVAETELMIGGMFAAEVTETLSKLVVWRVPTVPLATAIPMYTVVAMLIVVVDPT